jgi:alkaline phosphatase D
MSEERDLTATFKLSGLDVNTKYYYALISDCIYKDKITRRTELGRFNKHFFKTQQTNPEKLTFGFYSCHDPFSQKPHSTGAWPSFLQVLKDKSASFCIGGGDQIYVDTNKKEEMYSITDWLSQYKNQIIKKYSGEGVLDEDGIVALFINIYRMYYRLYWVFPEVQAVYQKYPQYMAWDDHEIMDGWGSYTQAERKELLSKLLQIDDEETNGRLIELLFQAAKRVYFEYQHSHNPDTNVLFEESQNSLCVWDYGYVTGNVAIYVLDLRGHHDFERSKTDSNALLGDKQMERFKSWLNSPDVKQAKAVFISTSVPIVHWGKLVMSLDFIKSAKDDLRDEWGHVSNWKERKKLLDVVGQYSETNKSIVTFLSGDVHCASVFRIESKDKPNARIFNATSSAISRKPNGKFVESFMAKDGKMEGSNDYTIKSLSNFSGSHNFMMLTTDFADEEVEVSVDLYWASDNDDISSRKIILEKVPGNS